MMSEFTEEIQCGHDGENWYCYRLPDGKTRQRVGCSHRSPRDAARHADDLKARQKDSDTNQ